MDIKTITIIALIALSGCKSQNDDATSSAAYAPQASDSPATRFRQECLNGGYDEQSKAFFDCMESQWFVWRKSNGSDVVANKETPVDKDGTLWLDAVERCKKLFESKKLKTNYERGQCVDKASVKYLAPHFNNQSALKEFRTDILLIAVKLDKKEISTDEKNVLVKRSWDKLMEAENTTIAHIQGQKAAWAQQAYQNQVQQQQYESARSAAMTQGVLGILQNHMQEQRQRQTYIPLSQDIKTECSTYYGKTTCYTNR